MTLAAVPKSCKRATGDCLIASKTACKKFDSEDALYQNDYGEQSTRETKRTKRESNITPVVCET